MQVETYEVEEINSSEAATMAADSEAIELCEKLGLAGQSSLTNTETATRNPYRKISALEGLVYTTLFTSRTPVEKYSSGPIPMRVLQVLAHAKECGMFTGYLVLHPADVRVKDPVLIGYKQYDWMLSDWFILARWGEAIESLEALAEKAKKKWLANRTLKLKEAIAKCEGMLKTVESTADSVFLEGNAPTESVLI